MQIMDYFELSRIFSLVTYKFSEALLFIRYEHFWNLNKSSFNIVIMS